MMKRKLTEDRLVAIQERLIGGCSISLQAGESWQAGQWLATIATERNDYPYWIRFEGATPGRALDLLEGFLAGKVPDRARNKRNPKVFLRSKPLPCPGGCDHTDAEHKAFDAGVSTGRLGLAGGESRYKGKRLESYLTGRSVGALDRSQHDGGQ
jgi:hypothetical protein